MGKKNTIALIVTVVIVVTGIFLATSGSDAGSAAEPAGVPNVSIIDGRQVVEITAKGGYRPRYSVAQAGLPTTLRINTTGTFDCSLALRIPSMGISKTLQSSGNTDIDLGSPTAQKVKGTCSMGMYSFEIEFKS